MNWPGIDEDVDKAGNSVEHMEENTEEKPSGRRVSDHWMKNRPVDYSNEECSSRGHVLKSPG